MKKTITITNNRAELVYKLENFCNYLREEQIIIESVIENSVYIVTELEALFYKLDTSLTNIDVSINSIVNIRVTKNDIVYITLNADTDKYKIICYLDKAEPLIQDPTDNLTCFYVKDIEFYIRPRELYI